MPKSLLDADSNHHVYIYIYICNGHNWPTENQTNAPFQPFEKWNSILHIHFFVCLFCLSNQATTIHIFFILKSSCVEKLFYILRKLYEIHKSQPTKNYKNFWFCLRDSGWTFFFCCCSSSSARWVCVFSIQCSCSLVVFSVHFRRILRQRRQKQAKMTKEIIMQMSLQCWLNVWQNNGWKSQRFGLCFWAHFTLFTVLMFRVSFLPSFLPLE